MAPGLPALARDMERDSNCLANESGGATRPLAEEISLRISRDNEDRQTYVVIPRVAGIVFARLGPAGPRAANGGRASDVVSSGSACVRASAVMARLEREGGGTGMMPVRHRFVLENLDVFRGDDDFRDSRAVVTERASEKKITRRLSLPVAYADLLAEATSSSPSPGGEVLRLWCPHEFCTRACIQYLLVWLVWLRPRTWMGVVMVRVLAPLESKFDGFLLVERHQRRTVRFRSNRKQST